MCVVTVYLVSGDQLYTVTDWLVYISLQWKYHRTLISVFLHFSGCNNYTMLFVAVLSVHS